MRYVFFFICEKSTKWVSHIFQQVQLACQKRECGDSIIDNCMLHVRWRSGRSCAAFKEDVLEKWEGKIDFQTRACDALQSHHPFWSCSQFHIRMHYDKPPHAPVSRWICDSFIAEHTLWDIKRKFQFRIHIIFFSVVFHVAVQIHSIVTSRCLFCGMKIIFTWIKKSLPNNFFPRQQEQLEIWEKSYGMNNEFAINVIVGSWSTCKNVAKILRLVSRAHRVVDYWRIEMKLLRNKRVFFSSRLQTRWWCLILQFDDV